MSKNPVVHFEMPYEDSERLSKFYTQAFDWKMDDMGEQMGNYIMAHGAETDENNMVKNPGNINGGFFPRNADSPNQSPSVVIAVEDINVAIEKIKEAGGEVLGEPMEIPTVGMYVSFRDTEGNLVGLIQGLG